MRRRRLLVADHHRPILEQVLSRSVEYVNQQQQQQPQGFSFDPDAFYYYAHQQHEQDFDGIIPFLGRLIRTLLVTVVLLSISAVSYGCFYTAVMPTYTVIAPLFFDYTGRPAPTYQPPPLPTPPLDRPDTQPPPQVQEMDHAVGDDSNVREEAAETTQTTPPPPPPPPHEQQIVPPPSPHQHPQEQQQIAPPLPWAAVDLFAKHSPWESGSMVLDVLPEPVAHERLLVSRQAYFLETVLELPETDLNIHHVGIFGLRVELRSSQGTLLAQSLRPCRFPHVSGWIRILQKILTLPPLLLGAWDESRTVLIPSFRHYVESKDHPARFVVVQIVPPPLSKKVVEVSRGELRMGKELNTFQELLKTWYFTCYSVGTAVFGALYFLVWTFYAQVVRRRRLDDRSDDDAFEWHNVNLGERDYLFDDATTTEDEGRPGDTAEQRNGDHGNSRRRRNRSNDNQQQGRRDNDNVEGDDEWEDLYYDTTDPNDNVASSGDNARPDEVHSFFYGTQLDAGMTTGSSQ